jgi:hypothetical protein
MVQVGSQKYIRVFKFLFSYFINQLMDDLHLSHMTKVGGKKQTKKHTHTHTHTHKRVGKSFFFLIRIWKNISPTKKSKISRIFNLKKNPKKPKKPKKKNPPNLLVFTTTKFVPKKNK